MKHIWVRPLKQDDLPKLAEWMVGTKDNLLDPKALEYPETTVLVAHDGTPLVFLPVQQTLTLESLGVRPGASLLDVAKALELLVKAVALAAPTRGVHEIYFHAHEETVVKMAKRHGFEDMTSAPETCPSCNVSLPRPHSVTLRLKLDDLDKPTT